MKRGEIAGLVLAAGESSRMGTDKALLPFRGSTFIEVIVQNLRSAGIKRIVVVLGHHAEEIERGANLAGAHVVVNLSYREGQTSSLQAGIRALQTPEPQAILLCLVDHPAVSAEVIKQLCKGYFDSRAPVTIPVFQGRRGHPVVIGRGLFQQLLNLKPVEGANTVIREQFSAARWVETADSMILLDIDEPDDYERLIGANRSSALSSVQVPKETIQDARRS
ncbi:MAG TPA: nucleotidyltransferase family protein [Terriglobia bacterium]|nr:nucleotidyltransferase family protein [Terriglobia bacterium]